MDMDIEIEIGGDNKLILSSLKKKEFIKREPEATRCYYWISPKEEIGVDTSW